MDANDFLMGGGVPSAKFVVPGDYIAGGITTEPEAMQQRDFATGDPRTWDDGTPRMQIKVVLDTGEIDPMVENDNGYRAIYLKGQMLAAVRSAVRKAGAKGLAVGGHLTVTYTGNGEVIKRGFNPAKLYSAVYEPPAVKLNVRANENDEEVPF
jgi:hypothetical protein